MKLVHFLIFYHQRLITCQIRLVSVCLKARNQSQQRLKSLFVGAGWVRHQINLPSCFPYVVYLLFLGGGVVTWEHCDLSPRVTEATYFSGGVEGSLIHVSRRLITVTVNIFTSITPHVSSVYEAETPVFIDSGAFSP